MKREDIFNILFWITLVIGLLLLLWYIFGNSPTELAIILTFMLMLMFKMWAISDNLNNFKYETKFSFHKVREDIGKINNKLDQHDNKLEKIDNRLNQHDNKLNTHNELINKLSKNKK
jgi:peptidoglycan hydrolase CwlO-like protein